MTNNALSVEQGLQTNPSETSTAPNTKNIHSHYEGGSKRKVYSPYRKKSTFCARKSTRYTCAVALFITVTITAVLIINFTSPKPSTTCDFFLKRIARSSIVFSSEPVALTVGDLNSDGQLDIVVANSGTNTIGVFLSKSDNSYDDQKTYSTGTNSHPISVIIFDINNDGHLDVAVANYAANSIQAFLGSKNGTLSSHTIFSTDNYHPFFLNMGDFTGDNETDLAVVNYGVDSISILAGNRDGSFQERAQYSCGYDSLPYSLAVGDVNMDKALDIVVANYGTNNIGVFLGYGDGRLSKPKTYSTGLNSNPSSVVLTDINYDRYLDAIVANYGSKTIGIFFGYGNGTFAMQTTLSLNSDWNPYQVTVGDFDRDNQVDVLVVDPVKHEFYLLLKYNNFKFNVTSIYSFVNGSSPSFAVVVDFNKDNQSDIIVANSVTSNVLLLSNYYREPSTAQMNYFVGTDSRPSSVILEDFTDDGQPDILVNNFNNNSLLLLIGDSKGNFGRSRTFSTGDKSAPKNMCVGDFNNDNKMDIVTANFGSDSIGVLLAQGSGSFSDVITSYINLGSKPWSVDVADFNNDKRLDVVTANAGFGGISILLGQGNGTFTGPKTFSTDVVQQTVSVAVGDINNDDIVDIVCAACRTDNLGIFFGFGNGDVTNATSIYIAPLSCPDGVTLSDFNNDNKLDLAFSPLNGGFIGVMIGYGNGSFQTMTKYFVSSTSSLYPVRAVTLHVNGQVFLDLVTCDLTNDLVIVFFGNGDGTFRLGRRYYTGIGSSPYAVADTNLVNSERISLIVTLWGSGSVAILVEYYAAKFGNEYVYNTGSAPAPQSVAIGNFSNDSYPDVAVVNAGNDSLNIWINSGNGSFNKIISYPLDYDSQPAYVFSGYVNRDNYVDIVTINNKAGSMDVFIGNANGSFDASRAYSTGANSYPVAAAMGDFNKDNRSDIMVANSGTNNVGVLIGYRYSSFQNYSTYSNPNATTARGIITIDFNNDTNLDLAVTFQGSDNLGVLLGLGNASFMPMTLYSTGNRSQPVTLTTDDFNNDGLLDIATANYGSNNIAVLFGFGNGSFGGMTTFSTGPNSLPIAIIAVDVNKDSREDLVVANSGSDNVGILLRYESMIFKSVALYSTGDNSQPISISSGDFDHDGGVDLVVANYGTSTIIIFYNFNGDSFTAKTVQSTGYQSWPISIVVGDLNNDSHLDIAVTNYNMNNVGVFLGYGNRTFTSVTSYATGPGSSPKFLSISDLNSDGLWDLTVCNSGKDTFVALFGFGDGTFLLGNPYSTGKGSSPGALVVGDFNNDRQTDIIITNQKTHNVMVFLEVDREFFSGVTTYDMGAGSKPYSIAVEDVNKDGQLDAVVANRGTDNIVILLGQTHGTFQIFTNYYMGAASAPYSVAIADLNQDRQLDIVVSNSGADSIAILFGHGNGSFSSSQIYSTGIYSQPQTVAVGDFDNNNILDIAIVITGTDGVLIFYGSKGGNFEKPELYPLGFLYRPQSLTIGDLNHDGRMDFVVACSNTNHVEIYMQTC